MGEIMGDTVDRPADVNQALRVETANGMLIAYDVPIPMDDGLVLRADVFRPLAEGRYPVLLSYGPYGKWLKFQDGYKGAWDIMASRYPDTTAGSTNTYQNWEVADPEKWIPDGYVCVRVDSRGAGRSPGVIDLGSPRETQDLYDCIEWAGVQPWSNGKIGLSGISYYATSQWKVAALNPPHLAAICVWEGFADSYRESSRHGGIQCVFIKNWLDMQIRTVQHGLGENGPKSAMNGEWVCGPQTLTSEQLAANRGDTWADFRNHPLLDDYYRKTTPDFSAITVPLLSAGNWGGQGMHLRGNVEGFVRSSSPQKWLELHGGEHWTSYYTDYGVALQKRFFGHFLKGEDNGWETQPPIQLQVRHPDERFVLRHEQAWPLPQTQWTKFYPDGSDFSLKTTPPTQSTAITFDALGEGVTFMTEPLEEELELTGPAAATLSIASSTSDADLFLVVRLFDAQGDEVLFDGAIDPKQPLAQGWLRASHRKLDPKLSTFYRPLYTHDDPQPLTPGERVELQVEIWPTCIVIPKGYRLGFTVLGRDYDHGGPAATLSNMKNPMRGCGPFVHDDQDDRPPAIFGGQTTLFLDAQSPASVLLPVIPAA